MIQSIVLVGALMTIAEARTRIEEVPPDASLVIRRELGGEVFWYVFPPGDARGVIYGAPEDWALEDAFNLHERDSVPAADPSEVPPLHTVTHHPGILLIEGDRVIGFVPQGDDVPAIFGRAVAGNGPKAPRPSGPRGTGSDWMGDATPVDTKPFEAEPRVSGPDRVRLNEPFQLDVGLASPPADDEVSDNGVLRFDIPSDVTAFELDVQVIADGFDAPNGFRTELHVRVADVEAETATVTIIPTTPSTEARRRAAGQGGDALWQAAITVVYLYRGTPVGMAAHRLLVTLGAGESEHIGYGQPRGWLADQPQPCAGPIVANVPEPDLTMLVSKAGGSQADGRYQAVLHSKHGSVPTTPFDIELGTDAASFAGNIMKAIPGQDGSAFIDNTMRGIATIVSKTVKDPAFWHHVRQTLAAAHRATGKTPTVLLLTAEPYIPWELADIGGADIEPASAPFLAVQARVGRWILTSSHCVPLPGEIDLYVDRMATVVGEYEPSSGLSRLPSAEAEGEFLRQKLDAHFVEAWDRDVDRVLNADLSQPVQLIHFACHGDSNILGTNALYMNDGAELLEFAIEGSDAGKEYHPLVFLNACRVGAGEQQLNQYGGFAGAFLRASYRGFIGPLWAVDDVVARDIAESFYKRLAAGEGPAEILRSVRARFVATDADPSPPSTYLAYVFYGHPAMTVTGLTYTGD